MAALHTKPRQTDHDLVLVRGRECCPQRAGRCDHSADRHAWETVTHANVARAAGQCQGPPCPPTGPKTPTSCATASCAMPAAPGCPTTSPAMTCALISSASSTSLRTVIVLEVIVQLPPDSTKCPRLPMPIRNPLFDAGQAGEQACAEPHHGVAPPPCRPATPDPSTESRSCAGPTPADRLRVVDAIEGLSASPDVPDQSVDRIQAVSEVAARYFEPLAGG